MPATSKKMRRVMAIAEHHPEMLYKRNRGMLKMSRQQLHEYASTSEVGMSTKEKNDKRRERIYRRKG